MTKIPELLANKNTTSNFLQGLRSQAERLVIPQAKESLSKLTMDDIARLVFELEAHQIELEMQNKELLLTQQTLIEVRDEYCRLYDDAPTGLLSIDRKGHILKCNKSALNMLNELESTITGKLFTAFIIADDQDIYYKHHLQVSDSHQKESCEIRLKGKKDKPLWVRLDSICDTDFNQQSCVKTRLVIIDISEQKSTEAKAIKEKNKSDVAMHLLGGLNQKLNHELQQKEHIEKKLKHMVKYDQLTDLTNRTFTSEKAYSTILSAKITGEKIGMMLVNLDNLMQINQSDGFLRGDVAIVETSLIIKEAIMECDFVGRWSCSSFLILLPQCESLDVIEKTAKLILEQAKIPRASLDQKILRLSIGLSLFPDHAQTTSKLISLAENSMYKAMAGGGDQFVSNN